MKRILVTACILGLLVVASAGQAAEKIVIGGLFSLTGGLAPYGPAIANGARLAVEHINAAGGILGMRLELVIRDDGTAPVVGRDAAAKLIELDGAVAIVGALSSGVTMAAAAVTVPAKVVLISPASTSPAITDLADNDYVFRSCVSDAMQGVVQAQLALNLGYRKTATIFVNNAYGIGLAKVFKDNFEAGGGRVVAMVPYEEGKPSYRGEVEMALREGPDAINLVAYPVDGNKMIITAIELGFPGKFLFPDGMKGEGVAPGPACRPAAPLAERYIEGAFGTAPGALAVGVRAQFEKDYAAAFGPSGIPFRGEAYDAVVLLALAMQAAGAASGPAIQANLRKVANPPGVEVTYGELARALELARQGVDINYQGVSGPITFDEHGDVVTGAIEIWVVRDCTVSTVWIVEVGK